MFKCSMVFYHMCYCIVVIIALAISPCSTFTCIHDDVTIVKSTVSTRSIKKYEEIKQERAMDPSLFEPLKMYFYLDSLDPSLTTNAIFNVELALRKIRNFVADTFKVRRRKRPFLLERKSCVQRWQSGENRGKCSKFKGETEACSAKEIFYAIPERFLNRIDIYNFKDQKPTFSIPSGHGVLESNFITFVISQSTSMCEGTDVFAYGTYCRLDQSGTNEPLAGILNLCPAYFSEKIYPSQHYYNILLHELFHILGFSFGLYEKFLPCRRGKICDMPKNVIREDSEGVSRMMFPLVIKAAQHHFGCHQADFGGPVDTKNPGENTTDPASDLNTEERVTIVKWQIQGKTGNEIRIKFEMKFKKAGPVDNTIYILVNKFNQTGSIHGEMGNRSLHISKDNVNPVSQIINENPFMSIRAAAQTHSVSKTLMYTSHWHPLMMYSSIMTPKFSERDHIFVDNLTLAVFASTGWYRVNFTKSESFKFGKGQTCKFGTNGTCNNSIYVCDPSAEKRGCDLVHKTIGKCKKLSPYSECGVYEPYSEEDCESNSDKQFGLDFYSLGYKQKCFMMSQNDTFTPSCLPVKCKSDTTYNVKYKTDWLSCDYITTVNNTNISLLCPESSMFCKDTEEPSRHNLCSLDTSFFVAIRLVFRLPDFKNLKKYHNFKNFKVTTLRAISEKINIPVNYIVNASLSVFKTIVLDFSICPPSSVDDETIVEIVSRIQSFLDSGMLMQILKAPTDLIISSYDMKIDPTDVISFSDYEGFRTLLAFPFVCGIFLIVTFLASLVRLFLIQKHRPRRALEPSADVSDS